MLPKTKIKIFLASLLAFSASFLFTQLALAQEVTLPTKDYFLRSRPGATLSETIVLQNTSSEAQVVNLSWQGYNLAENSNVNPSSTSKHSIDFATVSPTSITLQPQAVGNIFVQFNLPDNLLAGDYYGSLLVQSNSSEDQADFTIRTDGAQTEKIDTSTITDDGKTLSIAIANQGNITVAVDTKVKIHDLLWTKYDLTASSVKVRANEIKVIKIVHPNLKAGFWQEEITFQYGEKKTPFSALNSFWVDPILFAAPFILLLLAVTIFLFFNQKGHD